MKHNPQINHTIKKIPIIDANYVFIDVLKSGKLGVAQL